MVPGEHHPTTPPTFRFRLPSRALVMGLGVHGGGLGVTRWLLRQGVHVTVTDMASEERLAKPLEALRQTIAEGVPEGANISYVLGTHRAEDFTSHDMVVVNPAVRPDSPWLAMARAAGARIETEMTLFFHMCPGPILGITGTKGKTTTALLTAAMLRQCYPDTVVAGNLRVSALEALEGIGPHTPVVLELSSFQLMRLGEVGLGPRYAAITNFFPDHLDYHGSMEAYAQAKRQIFLHQQQDGVLVLHHDERLFWLTGAGETPTRTTRSHPHVRTFSTDPDSGADCYPTRQGVVVCEGEPLFETRECQLQGKHNLANVLTAAALVRSFGINAAAIRQAVCGFERVKHRLEPVAELDGVRYINDTTATNPTAALAALHSFDEPIVLLAGGADKGLPTETFAQAIVQRAKALVLLAGSATDRLEREVRDRLAGELPASALMIAGPYDDFAAAIAAARELAAPGDVVLLSPGCASFGMFRNEFHRGDTFRHLVTSLASSE